MKGEKKETLHDGISSFEGFAILNYPQKKRRKCGEYQNGLWAFTYCKYKSQQALGCVYFGLPYISHHLSWIGKRKQIIKHWKSLSMHVLHIITEMCFGVVEMCALKTSLFACVVVVFCL